jgi:transposase-like protein
LLQQAKEPQIVKKHQTTISDEIEEKILSMYGLGMSYTDISAHIEDIYQISISTATISAITDKIIDKVKAWQSRPLETIYPFVWLDAIHYKIKDGGKYISKAIYTILGVGMDGRKEILGLYLSESEGANFWLSVLTDLNNRGLKDILIASVDGFLCLHSLREKDFQKQLKQYFQIQKYNFVLFIRLEIL